ncbi:MAG: GIY-YIG nuclease family protein [Chloroflexota bacterium]
MIPTGVSRGSYVLLLHLPEAQTLQIGRLGELYFRDGYYAYVGSAMRGIMARMKHYRQGARRSFWHIDYLLQKASIVDVFVVASEKRWECRMAEELHRGIEAVPGFGKTDCACPSHLFFMVSKEPLRDKLKQIFRAAD